MSERTQSMSLIDPAGRAIVKSRSNPPRLLALRSPGRRSRFPTAVAITRHDVVVTGVTVPGGPRGEVPVWIVRPAGARRNVRTILYNVDRASCVGTAAVTHGRVVCELAIGVNAAVVVPASCLSPEPKQPTAIEERYAVARWVAGQGPAVGVDGSRLALRTDTARAIRAIGADLTGVSQPIPLARSSSDWSLRDAPRAA